MYLHGIFFKIVLLVLLPLFCKVFGRIYGNHFLIHQFFIAFAVTFSALVNYCHFRTLLFAETGQSLAVASPENMVDALKISHST
jgi:hypothetical protein